jgi:hypothetical protein
MAWFISVQIRTLALFKDGQLVQSVTFQRSRPHGRMPFLAWDPTNHDRTKFLPFTYYDRYKLKRIEEADMTYEWSPVQNQYSYYNEQDQ